MDSVCLADDLLFDPVVTASTVDGVVTGSAKQPVMSTTTVDRVFATSTVEDVITGSAK